MFFIILQYTLGDFSFEHVHNVAVWAFERLLQHSRFATGGVAGIRPPRHPFQAAAALAAQWALSVGCQTSRRFSLGYRD